jgi:hypothetical protein
MTKKDFKLIAKVFNVNKIKDINEDNYNEDELWEDIVIEMAHVLEINYSNFDLYKFYKECGLEDDEIELIEEAYYK